MNTLCSQKALRAAGERPTVIALYAAAGSPEQRRPLAERLRLRYRVLAPDLYGDAVGCASGAHPPLSLEAEAARIEPLLDAFPGPVYLVAHGYGAAVALKLAYRRRKRIGGLVLYFVDPGSRYVALDILVLRRMPELCAQLDAQFADPTPLAEYARIDAPVRLLTGARTRAANERIAELLAGTLPRAEWRRVDSADWMGPGARDEAVDREIEGFLAQQQANWHCDPEPTVVFGRPVFRCRAHARECAEAVSLSGPAPCPAPLGTRGEDRL
jgi:pimeloyl-ACP methyl ester carboxylesterase